MLDVLTLFSLSHNPVIISPFREQLSVCLLQEKCAGIERFLHILQLIVTQPGTAFKHFIPSSITLCMDHIYPVIAEHPAPSIKPAVFQLLFRYDVDMFENVTLNSFVP